MSRREDALCWMVCKGNRDLVNVPSRPATSRRLNGSQSAFISLCARGEPAASAPKAATAAEIDTYRVAGRF
jgi:hypothetical protein